MTAIDYVRFYWPVGMVVVFLWVLHQRIKAQAEFCLFATLTLFGISRLMSSDVVPLLVGLLDPSSKRLMSTIMQMHYVGQIIAATCGFFAVLWLSKRYSDPAGRWNRTTNSWEVSS